MRNASLVPDVTEGVQRVGVGVSKVRTIVKRIWNVEDVSQNSWHGLVARDKVDVHVVLEDQHPL